MIHRNTCLLVMLIISASCYASQEEGKNQHRTNNLLFQPHEVQGVEVEFKVILPEGHCRCTCKTDDSGEIQYQSVRYKFQQNGELSSIRIDRTSPTFNAAHALVQKCVALQRALNQSSIEQVD